MKSQERIGVTFAIKVFTTPHFKTNALIVTIMTTLFFAESVMAITSALSATLATDWANTAQSGRDVVARVMALSAHSATS